ncbi:MAG: hypothetical protein U0X73_17820 [Thermoanaerobaculia bacterium]
MSDSRRLALAAAVAGLVLFAPAPSVAQGGSAQAKVVATIGPSADSPKACVVEMEVRDPKTDQVLAAPQLTVRGGEEAKTSTAGAGHRIDVTVKAAPGCAEGSYQVRVFTGDRLDYEKSGPLVAKK